MAPEVNGNNVRAACPGCDGAVTTFEFREEGKELGHTIGPLRTQEGAQRVIFRLLKCAGCGRAAMAAVHGPSNEKLLEFFPPAPSAIRLPIATHKDIVAEFREAELCASVFAFRAGSAMLRSVLEKALKAHGYVTGNLVSKINAAAADGVIHESRRKRAHEEIRVLGNDILHDDWRVVSAAEFSLAHHYTQRILEDFYDDPATVAAVLLSRRGGGKP